MPNSAYLYSSDQFDPWPSCPDDDQQYCDSRWNLPPVWLFFYGPENIRMVEVNIEHSSHPPWLELKFVAEKQSALALFAARESLLHSLLAGRISRARIAEFTSRIGQWPGKYLLLDPDEVVYDDYRAYGRFLRRMLVLGAGSTVPKTAHDALLRWLEPHYPEPERYASQMLGAGA